MTETGRAVARYAVAASIAVAGSAVLLALAFAGNEARRALVMAGAVALVVQIGAFALARSLPLRQRIAGWGAGAGISLLTLIVFGLVARRAGFPPEAALLGMATFLFLTELIEPFFLK